MQNFKRDHSFLHIRFFACIHFKIPGIGCQPTITIIMSSGYLFFPYLEVD